MSLDLLHTLNGPPGAPVLVLSNSLGTSWEMWAAQVPAFSTDFQVLRYNQRGHGGSPTPSGPYEIADLGRDLLDLLDGLEIESASICGVSIGGMTAMWMAANHPDRVDRLALCFTAARMPAPEVYPERAATARAEGMTPLLDTAIDRWFTPEFGASGSPVVARTRADLATVDPEGYAGCCEALGSMDLREDIKAIDKPTLVVSASDDPATPPDYGRLIADTIPGARFELIEGARHLACIERPEEFTPLVLDHLEEGS
jgi:3-oxoadipate enol-lactonase